MWGLALYKREASENTPKASILSVEDYSKPFLGLGFFLRVLFGVWKDSCGVVRAL